ncbi:MAG: uroporphyrinogen-III synthase [Planctomycetota bacterium]
MRSAEESGWRAQALPLLQQESLGLDCKQTELLHQLGVEDCLFLTSKNGVRRLFELCQSVGRLPDCKYAVVGKRSASLLTAGIVGMQGRPSSVLVAGGDGASLAQTYLHHPVSGRLVFLGAESPRPELAAALHQHGASLLSLPAYRNESLPGPAPTAKQPVLLFSPSSVKSLAARVDVVSAHPVLALGRSTEQCARDLHFPLFGRLEAPTPESLTAFLKHV